MEIGDIVYVPLDREDDLVLNEGFHSRKKYIVVIGFTPEGSALGSLLVNSRIDPSKQSKEMLDCQYPVLARNYRDFLRYDSWIDCSDIFELSKSKIRERGGIVVSKLVADDRERIFDFLKETDVFDNITKRRFGLI